MRIFIVLFALVWVAGLSAALYWAHPEAFYQMDPAEWGEFLAGAFGPPSFIAVVATLIQQGGDLKRQQRQLANQLGAMQRQVEVQSSHAEDVKKQTELMVERLHIERASARANSYAMLIVRYADRLVMRPIGAAPRALVGGKSELREDFHLGPEAVVETMRQSLRGHTEEIRRAAMAVALDPNHKQRLEGLLTNLAQRAAELQDELESAPALAEIGHLRAGLALRDAERRVNEMLELVRSVSV